jgi:acyl dehydratase
MPTRDPDDAVVLATRPEQALLYRLNGDDNPLHIDPAVAKTAGFDRPILHGLCTLGVVMHALLRCVCGYDRTKPRHLALRFSAPVFPGETIRTELWDEGGGAYAFRARAVERDAVVVSNGLFRVSP